MNLMNILIATLAAVVAVIIAFVSGAYMGSHFYCPKWEIMKQKIPKQGRKFIHKLSDDSEDSSLINAGHQSRTDADRQRMTDTERQRQFEEDLKAFEACMNYSAERAYDMRGDYFSD